MSKIKNYILTANDLLEGDVIYLDNAGKWSRALEEAQIFRTDDDAKQALEANAHNNMIVGAYLAEVVPDTDIATVLHFRESFRANGPSTFNPDGENTDVSL